MRLHSVQTLGTKEIVSSQEDNYVYLLLWSAKTLQYALLRTPSNNICTIICFQLCPLCFVFYGPSLLSNMSGRKHLRCSLGLFAAPSSNHLAKLWHRNSPQLGHFWVKALCLFVFLLLTLTNADHLSEFSGKPRKIESLNPGHNRSFILAQSNSWRVSMNQKQKKSIGKCFVFGFTRYQRRSNLPPMDKLWELGPQKVLTSLNALEELTTKLAKIRWWWCGQNGHICRA